MALGVCWKELCVSTLYLIQWRGQQPYSNYWILTFISDFKPQNTHHILLYRRHDYWVKLFIQSSAGYTWRHLSISENSVAVKYTFRTKLWKRDIEKSPPIPSYVFMDICSVSDVSQDIILENKNIRCRFRKCMSVHTTVSF